MKPTLLLACVLLSPAFAVAAEGGSSLPAQPASSLPAQPASSLRDGGAAAPWVPFAAERGVEPGSALDFSRIAAAHAPCGVHGRVVVRDGHFEFEDRPGEPVRFWGVNICSGANFPDEDKAEGIAANLAALGYNAVRLHHHDGGLVGQNRDATALDPDALRRQDATRRPSLVTCRSVAEAKTPPRSGAPRSTASRSRPRRASSSASSPT